LPQVRHSLSRVHGVLEAPIPFLGDGTLKQLWVWIAVVTALGAAVFSGAIVRFEHFWQAWELLAASTAAIYNLCFAIVVYALRHEKGEGTLHDALANNIADTVHLLLRVSLPTLLFGGTTILILSGRGGVGPLPAEDVFRKLLLTLAAFMTVWIGDIVTAHQLGAVVDSNGHPPYQWMTYFKTRVWLIDFPFVVGYVGLICIFTVYWFDRPHAPDATPFALLLQAFIGGASALEMLIQSAIHGFSEIAA
jgi:hypothetical protein